MPQNLTKSSPSIWHLPRTVKSTVKISSNFVAFLENTNFNPNKVLILERCEMKLSERMCRLNYTGFCIIRTARYVLLRKFFLQKRKKKRCNYFRIYSDVTFRIFLVQKVDLIFFELQFNMKIVHSFHYVSKNLTKLHFKGRANQLCRVFQT